MELSLDSLVLWQRGPVLLNATILYTWLVMALLVVGSWLGTRRLSTGARISKWQNLLEVLVASMREQIRQISQQDPGPFLPFIGTLFVFISFSNLSDRYPRVPSAHLFPVHHRWPWPSASGGGANLRDCPTGSMRGYLSHYLKPTVLMLPFHILSELTRTLALAVRLFGNVMSGALIGSHSPGGGAAVFSVGHAIAGVAHRPGPGLYLRGAGHRLYRFRGPGP